MAGPAYRIETPRLVLEAPDPAHARALKDAMDTSRGHLARFMSWADREPETLDEVVARLRFFRSRFDAGEDFVLAVHTREGGPIVGGTGLHPRVGSGGLEIGYWVSTSHLRRGIATEIAGALTRVAFEVFDCRWVEIRCARSNVESAGIPPKLGFVHEATLRDRLELPRGVIEDALVFTMLAKDYANSDAAKIPIQAFDAAGRKIL
jgi:RimJ/RimL family protein N-acetyltransferase